MFDDVSQFYIEMQESTNYIKIEELKNWHSYKIWARNAFVGIWVENESGFFISRYKVAPNPYLFIEYHWDTWSVAEPFGTVKPLELIEKCPFELKGNFEVSLENSFEEKEEQRILKYLDNLEECNPVVDGVNTVQERKLSEKRFRQRLAGKTNWRDV